MTVIKKCACEHEYQDKAHGKDMRVHNKCVKGARCTVCGNITNVAPVTKN